MTKNPYGRHGVIAVFGNTQWGESRMLASSSLFVHSMDPYVQSLPPSTGGRSKGCGYENHLLLGSSLNRRPDR